MRGSTCFRYGSKRAAVTDGHGFRRTTQEGTHTRERLETKRIRGRLRADAWTTPSRNTNTMNSRLARQVDGEISAATDEKDLGWLVDSVRLCILEMRKATLAHTWKTEVPEQMKLLKSRKSASGLTGKPQTKTELCHALGRSDGSAQQTHCFSGRTCE